MLCANHYSVGKVLGAPGGFGITYLAWDNRLETKVAIKEYLPRHLASRSSSIEVRPHTETDAADFRFGLEQFLNEAKTLARMKHPNIIRILTYFEENGTAYLVMDYLEGENLGEYLARVGQLTSTDGIQLILPIVDALSHIHAQGFIHRDVKPSNIYLTKDGQTILLDFGAARQALQEKSQSLTSILTPGYAPWEQYHRKGNQGPWTDIYACAAVIYQMITAQLPLDSQERLVEDLLVPPNKLNPSIPGSVSSAILHALSLNPPDRPQTAALFADELKASISNNESSSAASTNSATAGVNHQQFSTGTPALPKEISWAVEETHSSSSRFFLFCAFAVLLIIVGFGGYQYFQRDRAIEATSKTQAMVLAPKDTPSPVQSSESKNPPANAKPISAVPLKPLTLQDGKILPFPYMLREIVTRDQILNSGLGPLISSERKYIDIGGAGLWGCEYRFAGITISTISSAKENSKNNPPPLGTYKETIASIVLVDQTYETSRGLKVGMNKQDLIDRYGQWGRGMGGITYPLAKSYDDITLRVAINSSGIITTISVAYPLN